MRLRPTIAALAAAGLLLLTACDAGGQGAAGTSTTSTAPSTSTESSTSTGSSTTSPAPTSTPDPGSFASYVALGDSYTAAPGVPQTELTSGCLRSTGNYPTLLAARLGVAHVDVSCSAATTLSTIGVQQIGDHTEPPQFDAVTALGSTKALVTVGMGANDFDLFSTLITTCTGLAASDPGRHPCQDHMHQVMATAAQKHGRTAPEGADLLLSKIHKIQGRVAAVLTGVRDRAPRATVVLVGYPQAVPAVGTCASLPLATGDYPYVRTVLGELDDAMAAAARKGGATFVDVLKASEGHDICAGDDAWVNGSATDITRAVAYHPFAAEQQAVAGLIEAKLGLG